MADGYFETRFTRDENREAIWRAIAEYLQRYIPEDANVLDIGAGYCDFINNVNAKGRHALDRESEVLKNAAKGVETHVGDCEKMPFEDGYFDVVFASNLFEHLSRKELERGISEVRRVLNRGGKLILIQPNFRYASREYFDDYTHKFVFSHVSVADFLSARGFDVEKVVPRFLPFSMKSRLPSSAFLVRIYLRLPLKPFAKQMLVIAERG